MPFATWLGCLWAATTGVLAPLYLPAAAALAVLGPVLAITTRWRHRRAGLLAWPVLLLAMGPPPAPAATPIPGPHLVQGPVARVRFQPSDNTTLVWLADRTLLHVDGPCTPLPGDRLRAIARASPPATCGEPGTLRAPAAAVACQSGPPSLVRGVAWLRRELEQELLRLCPGEAGALLATLVLGRGTATAPGLTEAHRATGLSHLLAVSGAHAAVLAALLGLGGARRGSRLRLGPVRHALTLALLVLYAAVTGNEPPVVRTLAAVALGAVAIHHGRPLPLGTVLLVPATWTAAVDPAALLGPSFQLSYAAVLGLWVAARPATTWAERWLWAPLRASACATLLTAPFTLWWFHQLAPWTVVLTPLLAPLVGILLAGGLAIAALGCLAPRLAEPLAGPLRVLADAYAAAVCRADDLPGTPWFAPTVPPTWSLVLAGLAAVVVWERCRSRRGLLLAAAITCLPHFLPCPTRQPPGLRLFAVGHGQACLVDTAAGHRVAVDCGSLQQPGRAARVLAAGLHDRSLDLLVITHADQDHHNGVTALLRHVPIRRAVLPAALAHTPLAEALAMAKVEVQCLASGSRCEPLPGIQVAAPQLPPGASDNDLSLWVTVSLGDRRALLTGDAEAAGVAAALAQGLVGPAELLVLPHHGRPNARGADLLRVVRPRLAFASAPWADGDTQLGRLARGFGADLLVTGQKGDLQWHPSSGISARPPPSSTW